MSEIKAKIKELVMELEQHSTLSFRESLVKIVTDIAVNNNIVEKEELEGKTVDEKIAVLKTKV